ncbi:MAG: galactokinase family protein [Candidatus Omnitrophota bacterium]
MNTRIEKLKVSAPARICLFGEHQDFLGLSVIAMGISLRMRIDALRRKDGLYCIHMPDINAKEEFIPSGEISYGNKRDYLKSAVNVLKRKGFSFKEGYDFTITSQIPINAGSASSSVMVVAWIKMLLDIHGDTKFNNPEDIANFGYLTEVVEFGEPGGMMDHYSSAFGGIIYIDCKQPISYVLLDGSIDGFVLGHSLEKKDTTGVLRKSRQDVENGIEILKQKIKGFNIKTTELEKAKPYLREMDAETAKKLLANFENRDICQEALNLIKTTPLNQKRLGELLSEHHRRLRDGLGISTEKIEKMITASINAGALGCKINGSGGGGTMIAYAPGRQEEVALAIDNAGGKAYIIKKDTGVREETK